MELPLDFIHTAPKGYSYELQNHKRNVISIWIRNLSSFSYTSDPIKSIWGFYNIKTKQYFAPKNSKTLGNVVDINSTTPYTAMQLNLKGLESFFV